MKKTATFFEKYQFLIAAVIVGVLFVYSNSRQTTQSESKETVKIDTVFVENGKTIDSLKAVIDDLQQNIGISVREQQAAAAVYQVQYYIDITEKRPQNKTFFFGWVKRAIKEFIEYDNELKKEKK
jgi:hypothetical protein